MNSIAKFAQFRRSTVTGRYRVLKSPEYEPRMTSETKQKRSSKRLLVIACLALVAFIAIGVLVSTNNPAKNQSSGAGGRPSAPKQQSGSSDTSPHGTELRQRSHALHNHLEEYR